MDPEEGGVELGQVLQLAGPLGQAVESCRHKQVEGCGSRETDGKVPAMTGSREISGGTRQQPQKQSLVLLGLGCPWAPHGRLRPLSCSEKGPHWAAMWVATFEQSTVGTVPPPTHHCPSWRPSAWPAPACEAEPDSTVLTHIP